jgi:tryptophan halogenase
MLVESVCIVGGGSSGWMTASALSKLCPHLQIALVESPTIKTVGVGESTLGHFNKFLRLLELKDEDWMSACNATYKNSIRFTNFAKKDSGSFEYPFQNGFDFTEKGDFLQLNVYNEIILRDPDFPVDFAEFYATSNTLLAKHCKETKNTDNKLRLFDFDHDTAYHLDAELFGQYLKDNIAIPNGVLHIVDDVVGQVREETYEHKDHGVFNEIITENGLVITADLFIDCTGFKSKLLEGTCGSQFMPFDRILANDKAWAVRIPYGENRELEMQNVTDCTALDNGWVWNIPLWNRIGTGYVFSTRFTTPEDAKQEFLDHLSDRYGEDRVQDVEPFLVNIKHGKRRRAWVHNVVGIGLAYGFVEPLESTGLLTTHENIIRLVEVLNRRKGFVTRSEKESYNLASDKEITGFAKFVSMHYAFSGRTDTPYWQWCTEINEYDLDMIDGIVREPDTYSKISESLEYGIINPDLGGVPYILSGLGVNTVSTIQISNMRNEKARAIRTEEELNRIKTNFMYYYTNTKDYIETLPSHYQFLKENIYGGIDKYEKSI